MTVAFSSLDISSSLPPVNTSQAAFYAAKEFARFSNTANLVFTGPTTVNVTLQAAPVSNNPSSNEKKANPWVMMAALTLLKLPFSFLLASSFNAWLFKIPMSHSIQKELLGIGAEVLGTIGIKLVDDSLDRGSGDEKKQEKQLEIASGVVSFVGTAITTFACTKESVAFKALSKVNKGLAAVASLAVGTLCGVVEGYCTAKMDPWLEKQLSR